jgi:ribonuclease-3
VTRGALPAALRSLPDEGADPAVIEELAGLRPLITALGYEFARPALLRVALTLGSWCNEHPHAGWPSHERLEFFGDAVLDLLSAERLWLRFDDASEGALTRMQARVVSEAGLATVARALGLGAWLFVGRGDEQGGARERDGSLADALEAALGAIFLDARACGRDPLAAAGAAFDRLFAAVMAGLDPGEEDVKSRLGRVVQGRYRQTPRYVCAAAEGSTSAAPWWIARVELTVEGAPRVLGAGEGATKREAQRAAAAAALVSFEP